MNGARVLQYELGSAALLAAVEKSKFKGIERFGKPQKGHILLQDHGDRVWIRNIRILTGTDRRFTMTASHRSRREFIRIAGAGAAGLALAYPASSQTRIRGANDRVRVGIVGFSDRTKNDLIPSFMKHAAELNFEIVADLRHLEPPPRRGIRASSRNSRAAKPALCRNNDELYERNDVDAVIIATSDFQHAMHGVEAMKAGRDAYIEKPLANTMADAKAIRAAVRELRTDRADRHATSELREISARLRFRPAPASSATS